MFWNEEIETMSRQDLEELQLKKLKATVKEHLKKYHTITRNTVKQKFILKIFKL